MTADPTDSADGGALLEVKGLKVHFPIGGGWFSKKQVVKAVDGIDLTIRRGETLGLVGESGCGKSTAGRGILQLVEPTAGEVRFDGTDVIATKRENPSRFRELRRELQIIFQDPYASLNPRMTVADIISEPIRTHQPELDKQARQARVEELMKTVGLKPEMMRRYPHAFSGGQRQRIGIARALACDPRFIVCDEPISALDVSIQAQVLNLLDDLQQKLGLTYLFIAHDIAAVRHISDRVAVMYLGHIVEEGQTRTICDRPKHPYTQALISAVPIPDPEKERQRELVSLREDVDLPSPINPPSGCVFHTRCPFAWDRCKTDVPTLQPAGDGETGHRAACHLIEEPERAAATTAGTATAS